MNDEDAMDREAAEQYPCPYLIRPTRGSSRREPLRCGAEAGESCRDPRSGHELTRHAAHLPRLVLAGRAAASVVPGRAPAGKHDEAIEA